MNIFFVMDNKVITPKTDGAILKGITRDSIITLLKEKGYTVEEKPVDIHELIDGYKKGLLTEAFGTGTAAVVAPISEIAYKNEVIKLQEPTDTFVSSVAKDMINGMRSGRIVDPKGWVVPVKILETAK